MTTATSSAVVAPIAMIFAFNDDLVSHALDGLTPQELWHAPTEQNNAMLWLAKLASLDEKYLASPATMALPGVRTIADQLGFFALHDTYHVGQLAYIRKALGYPGLAG